MKRIFALVAIIALSACTTTGPISSKTPAQVAEAICPSMQSVMVVLSVPGVVDPAIGADVLIAASIVDAACSAGDIELPALQTLSRDAVPVLLKAITASAIPDQEKQAAVLGIAIAQAALAPVLR